MLAVGLEQTRLAHVADPVVQSAVQRPEALQAQKSHEEGRCQQEQEHGPCTVGYQEGVPTSGHQDQRQDKPQIPQAQRKAQCGREPCGSKGPSRLPSATAPAARGVAERRIRAEIARRGPYGQPAIGASGRGLVESLQQDIVTCPRQRKGRSRHSLPYGTHEQQEMPEGPTGVEPAGPPCFSSVPQHDSTWPSACTAIPAFHASAGTSETCASPARHHGRPSI